MKKFTFKTTKPAGPYSSFYNDYHEITYNKIVCGNIKDETWEVRFQVKKKDIMEDGNPNCAWRWIQLKTPDFENIKEAKSWVKENTKGILNFFEENNTPLWLGE